MSIAVKTRSSWPVSISEAKRHLRVDEDFHDDDDYIQNLVYAATERAQNWIGKDIAETVNVQELFDWTGQYLTVQEGNFISYTQGIIEDSSTLVTAVDTQIYYNYAYIKLSQSVSTDEFTPFIVTYKTGYEEQQVPVVIKQAIQIMIGGMYDGDEERVAKTWQNMLNAYRKMIF